MPLRSLAFGPLPKAQVQASQRIGQAAPSGGPRLSGLGGGGGGDYDAALTVGGPQREPEAFSPVFPDLFAANQGGGDVMDLPGAGGEPDFNSATAQGLASPGPAASQDTGGLDAGGFQNDFTKAMQALQQGMKLGKSGKGLLDWLGTSGGGFPTAGAGLAGEVGAGLAPPSDVFNPGAMGGGTGGGLGGGLGLASGGGAALSALLSILAQATGNPEMATAAKAAGAATGAVSLASSGANLGALASGASLGAGAGAGLAFAPITAALLVSALSGLAGGEDPFGEGIGEMMEPLMGDYYKFAPKLGKSLTNSGQGLSTLSQALPYVQSQEELGRLLNTYKNFVGTTNDWELGNQFGEGGVTDPYRIGNLPGAGGSSHEGGVSADFGPQVNLLQSQIDALRPSLPGTPITGGYGSPGGGFDAPADLMRLWTQFRDREQNAPVLSRGAAATSMQSGEGNIDTPAVAPGFYGTLQTPDDLRYGQEGYDYAGSGFPEPGKYVGNKSAAYQNLTLDSILRALMGGSNGSIA